MLVPCGKEKVTPSPRVQPPRSTACAPSLWTSRYSYSEPCGGSYMISLTTTPPRSGADTISVARRNRGQPRTQTPSHIQHSPGRDQKPHGTGKSAPRLLRRPVHQEERPTSPTSYPPLPTSALRLP